MKDSVLKEAIKNLSLSLAQKTQVDDSASDSIETTYSAAKIEERLSESVGSAPEGTAIKSTGETGGTKFLRENGDGTCSWQTPSGSSPIVATGAEVDAGTDNTKMVTPKAMEDSSYSKLALGETSATAYRGDRGKTAYDHSQSAHAPSDADKTETAIFESDAGDVSDAERFPFVGEGRLQYITYSSLLSALKEYFDTIYAPL